MRKAEILVLATLAALLFVLANSGSVSALRVGQDRLQQLTSSFDDEFEKYAVRVSQAAGTAWSAKSTRRGRSQRGRHLAVCPTGSVACGATCIDTLTDAGNCGSCGTVCPVGRTCCAGGCVDLMNDIMNCRDCGTVCGVVYDNQVHSNCVAGLCNYGTGF